MIQDGVEYNEYLCIDCLNERQSTYKIVDDKITIIDNGKQRSLSWGSEFSTNNNDSLPTVDYKNSSGNKK